MRYAIRAELKSLADDQTGDRRSRWPDCRHGLDASPDVFTRRVICQEAYLRLAMVRSHLIDMLSAGFDRAQCLTTPPKATRLGRCRDDKNITIFETRIFASAQVAFPMRSPWLSDRLPRCASATSGMLAQHGSATRFATATHLRAISLKAYHGTGE